MSAKEIREYLADLNPEAELMDGFDDALVGVVCQFSNGPLALYDRNKCIKTLMDRDGMTWEGAEEFFSFNCEGAWVGPNTPCIAVFGDELTL